MRSFKHISQLIKSKRQSHPKNYSQSDLSHLLGYKNGQFISNVERSLCSIPLKMLTKVCSVLDIHADELKEAILKDHEETLNNYLNIPANEPKDTAFIHRNPNSATSLNAINANTGTTSSGISTSSSVEAPIKEKSPLANF